ncbi:sulfite exporter TauE/SafE family protein [Paenibacillus contaminans]|uniref:Probable membrane transporter protein n=1 Tax=Paenibacillus contaminans TaxID=450362 RepID=A0A329LXT2_9BACL|nr:sulfite exporter TauE/SafE family protein [Paenibacillus contaminans]RAV12671.1 hypothetical protein DQG23_34395 [Paenibacillus contaminans]
MFIGFVILFLIGLVSATFGSIVGLGGGIIIVPALTLLGPALLNETISSPVAVGTSLTVLIVTALASTVTYVKQGKVDFRSGWLYFAASGPASILGASFTGAFNGPAFQLTFGFFMLFMAGLMVARDYLKPVHIDWSIQRVLVDASGTEHRYGYNVISALLVGVGVGLISGLFGIGGGSLFVPLMVLLFRYPPHVATATSMFVIFLSAILGSATHVALGEVDWLAVAALAPGAWFGGKLGARIASRMSGKGLLWLLRITLFVLAVRMIAAGL